MTAEHTPVPWNILPGEGGGWTIHTDDAELATVSPPNETVHAAETEANAYVIAAAPSLLLACRRAEAELTDPTAGPQSHSFALRIIRAAIGKAVAPWELTHEDHDTTRLIAAAPDLLAACKQLLLWRIAGHGLFEGEANIRAAIAKAEDCAK